MAGRRQRSGAGGEREREQGRAGEGARGCWRMSESLGGCQVFVNAEGQGVMVRNLPETLYFVVDGGDKGQAIRIINAASPARS